MNLFEEVALTKGSQRVLNDKKLVAGIADALRDDVMVNPGTFPAGFAQQAKKADDATLARWFLENLDKIEKEGYEGVVYSRDGVNSDWIARRYIAGSHSWEDIIGVLNMNLRDFYALKNRDLLDANHKDLPKFNSVRELGRYLTIHYGEDVKAARDAAKQAAAQKMAKSAKLVDNEDYRIYTVFNWAAARALGLGTQWCTANSSQNLNYDSYSNRGMLFQLYPKNPEKVDKTGAIVGKRTVGDEKYQFDAGSMSFNDIADDKVPAALIKEKFPYLYTDLVAALKQSKEKLTQAMDAMSQDPALNATKEGKTKTYDVDEEITKLAKFINAGYFTDKKRPKTDEEPAAAQPAIDGKQTTTEEYIMEMDKDVKAMMESLKRYDQLLNESAKKSEIPAVHRKEKGGDWKVTQKDLDKEDEQNISGKKGLEKLKKEKGIVEAEENCDACEHPKNSCVCEDVDQEVMEWVKRLESTGILGEEKKPDADGDGVPDWADKKPGKDDKEDDKEDKKVDEGVDPEVLAWMKRFDKLGKLV